MSTPEEKSISAECQELLNKIAANMDKADKALDAPLKGLSAARALTRRLANMAAIPWPDALSNIPEFMPDGLMNSLYALMDCPVITDSPEGAIIGEALDYLNAGEDLPSDLTDAMMSGTQKALDSQIDDAINKTPAGKLGKASSAYSSAVKDSGALGYMNTVEMLIQCARSACAAQEKGTKALKDAEDYLAKKKEEAKVWGTEVEDIVLADTSVPEEVKAKYASAHRQADKIKADVTKRLGGLF